MDLRLLFPQGRWVRQVEKKEQAYALPFEGGFWVLTPSSLTEREQALLELLGQQDVENVYRHPWLDFLENRGKEPAVSAKAVQFVYLHIRQTSLEDTAPFFDMLAAFFQNYLTYFQLAPQDYALVLDQTRWTDVAESIEDTLAAMEFDFASQLSFLIGNVLPAKDMDLWPAIFQLEKQLFQEWNQTYSRSACLLFSRLYLWGKVENPSFANYLHQRIAAQEGLSEIILALWQEGAVLTKAAQKLYIHRNTLQYRLEKFHEATGLSLKNMDDLALCYLVMISESF